MSDPSRAEPGGRVRSALFLPASNSRAIEKARGLSCDLAILDLEDAVKDDLKQEARQAAIAALSLDWRPNLAVRVNGIGSRWHEADVKALAAAGAPIVVLPKAERAEDVAGVAAATGTKLLAMIETPAGLYAARGIAAEADVIGLIAGTNDLAAELRVPPSRGRAGLSLALQMIVMAARAGGGIALDGVYNHLENGEGLEEECGQGRALGFDGKTLIHPSQIEPANRCFGASETEIEEARALIAAATGGAERFRGRMIEAMHVESAKLLLKGNA